MKLFINTFKLLKYDFQKKFMIFGLLFFTCMTVGYSIGNAHGHNMPGAYFWGPFMGIFPLQALFNVLYSKYVVSSPKFKDYIIKGTVILHSVVMIFMYLLSVVFYYLLSKEKGFAFDLKAGVVSFILVAIGLAAYIQVYYRNAFLGMLCIIPIMIVIIGTTEPTSKFMRFIHSLKFNDMQMLLIGVAGLVVCEVVLYVIARLLYKVPFSDNTMKRMLSKVR